MVIYSVFMVSKNGGLIYHCDHHRAETEIEKTFTYPLDLKLAWRDNRLVVTFGQRDGIKVGYSLMAINGETVTSRKLGDKEIVTDILEKEESFPLTLKYLHLSFDSMGYVNRLIEGIQYCWLNQACKSFSLNTLQSVLESFQDVMYSLLWMLPRPIRFGIAPLSSNEKIVFASMFHSMCAIASLQLNRSLTKDQVKVRNTGSGIEVLETDNFRLNCFQTLTGLKIIVISDLSSFGPNKEVLLRKIYDLYTDFALKNPFYSLDMPIRCELFDSNLQMLLEQREM